jgi:hypothetical protein
MGCALCSPQHIGLANSNSILNSVKAIYSRSDGRCLEIKEKSDTRALKQINNKQNTQQPAD